MSEWRRMFQSDAARTARAGSAPRVLRIGGIDYLNALPLLWGLDTAEGFDLSYHVPSRLAAMLAGDRLDTALVPVVAWADRSDYAVVPDVAISSYGGVESIRLYHREPLERVRRVGLDSSSRTSALLLRLLFRERWGADPEYDPLPPDELAREIAGDGSGGAGGSRGPLGAALLIGDAALESRPAPGWDTVDLGSEWTRWTGLPFVYAVWAVRPLGFRGAAALLVERLERARDEGVAHIDDIVARGRLPQGFAPHAARRYLHHVIRYHLGDGEQEALRLFFHRLRAAGIADLGGGELRFLQPE